MKKSFVNILKVELTGTNDERDAALKWLFDNDFRIRRGGPAPVKDSVDVDVSRFLFIAEKEVWDEDRNL